jgi:hypothetical protein
MEVMLKNSGFHFSKSIILGLGVLSLMIFAVDASAQTENEKIEEITPKQNDRIVLEDHTVIQDHSVSKTLPSKSIPHSKTAISSVKRDMASGESVSEKDIKKNESPSTLSFNIFLYIVDKFKAD